MKSHVSLFLLFLLLAVFPAFHADASQSTDADAPASVKSIACPSVNDALHVDGRQLTDAHGNAVQLKGIAPTVLPGSRTMSVKKLFISFVRNGM